MLRLKMGWLASLLLIPLGSDANEGRDSREALLRELAGSAAIPGLSFGSLDRGRPHELVVVGLADAGSKAPVTVDTIFEAASLSKPVLAFIVLKLVERGELALDQPLHEILTYPRLGNQAEAKRVTARHVLAHQTGLPNWGGEALEFAFEPGTGWRYSGEGYVYLQRVVEKLTDLSLQALAQREVFEPLGMTNSYFTWTEGDKLTLAKGHDRAGAAEKRGIPSPNAASSLHTTAADYLKFVAAWFNPEHLAPASRAMAFTAIAQHTKGDPATAMGWGLGWGVYGGTSKVVWHWGDNGVFRALVAVQPETRNAFVYFTNSQNGLAIARQLLAGILPGNDGIAHWLAYGQAESPLWQAEQKGYELEARGEYKAARRMFEKVLAEYPDSGRIKSKISWLEPLINPPEQALRLTTEVLEKLVGRYEDRVILFEDGTLSYRRGEGAVHTLVPFYGNVFSVGKLRGFRLEVIFDEQGNVTKLVGQYDNGYRDESIKSAN